MAAALASVRRARPLLGTFVDIIATGEERAEVERAVDAAFAAVAEVHRLMSFHDAGSDVARLNRDACLAPVAVDPLTFQVLELALDLHQRSGGDFDVAVAPALQDLGLLPAQGHSPSMQRMDVAGSQCIELLAGCRVRFQKCICIDLGGIAKGFAVDRAIEVLKRHAVAGGLVNAGGDLAAFGPEAHGIDVRDPRDPQRLLCQVEISDQALASSGRRFDPFLSEDVSDCAIIDPHSRPAARGISGATVVAPSCVVADALTKIVMLAGPAAVEILKSYEASALIVLPDGEVRVTPNWKGIAPLAA
jgi:FAD:protein FMN transferase